MIKICRPADVPQILVRAGRRKTQELCEAYDGNRREYDTGDRKHKFESNVYAHRTVKEALLLAQRQKCCYCESKFSATSYGAVEHFRPKGAVLQRTGDDRLFPGYYWLAYDWTNLLVSCEKCNTSHKGILFPLENPDDRARSHYGDVGNEAPLFVDPCRDEPRKHLRFRGAGVEPLTRRGRESISGFGLRRGDLEEARWEKLEILRTLVSVVRLEEKVVEQDVGEVRGLLEHYQSPESEYSAMARDFLVDKQGSVVRAMRDEG